MVSSIRLLHPDYEYFFGRRPGRYIYYARVSPIPHRIQFLSLSDSEYESFATWRFTMFERRNLGIGGVSGSQARAQLTTLPPPEILTTIFTRAATRYVHGRSPGALEVTYEC